LLTVDLEKIKGETGKLEKENNQYVADNEKTSKSVPELKDKIENLRQKIQLNEMLKEVDLDEIKMLKQNNMSVNSAITGLVQRWENLEGK